MHSEVHGPKIGHYPEWEDVPRRTLANNHELYCADEEELEQLAAGLGI